MLGSQLKKTTELKAENSTQWRRVSEIDEQQTVLLTVNLLYCLRGFVGLCVDLTVNLFDFKLIKTSQPSSAYQTLVIY